MRTITIDFDAKNTDAMNVFNFLKTLSFITVHEVDNEVADNESPYDKQFVAKIERSLASKGKAIKTEDLWK